MIYKFNPSPIDRIKIFIENKWLEYTDKVWNKEPHKITCHICGDFLKSQEPYSHSPEQCGWRRIDGERWYICHRCLCHRNYRPYVGQVDEDERKAWERILGHDA